MSMMPLSRSAWLLLQRLLNSPTQTITGMLLRTQFRDVADTLISGGYLLAIDGCAEWLDDEDVPRELEWHSTGCAYRYFSPAAGWSIIPCDEVQRYGLNKDIWLSWLRDQLEIGTRYRTTVLEDAWLCYLGVARFGHYRIHVYSAEGLLDSARMVSLYRHLKYERSRRPALVITTHNMISVMDMPIDVLVRPLEGILSREGDVCQLDNALLQSLLEPTFVNIPMDTSVVLRYSTDYRQVTWNGKVYSLTKKQATVLEVLVREGGRAHKDLLQAEANTNEEIHRIMRNKVNGQWKVHPLWGSLIQADGSGYYRLISA